MRPVTAIGRLKGVIPTDAATGAHEGPRLSEVAVPPILEVLQVVAWPALVLPLAASSMGPP